MDTAEKDTKLIAPERCPKCGGSIVVSTTTLFPIENFLSVFLSTRACLMCGFFGEYTSKKCSICKKEIIKVGQTEQCLGCHDKWSSKFIQNFYSKKVEKIKSSRVQGTTNGKA